MKTEISALLRAIPQGADVSEAHTVSRMRGRSPNSSDSLSPVCLSRHSCRQDIAASPVFIGKTGFLGGKDALTSDILHENYLAGPNHCPQATFRFNAHQAFRLYHIHYIIAIPFFAIFKKTSKNRKNLHFIHILRLLRRAEALAPAKAFPLRGRWRAMRAG